MIRFCKIDSDPIQSRIIRSNFISLNEYKRMTLKLKIDSKEREKRFYSDIFENGQIFYIVHPEGGAYICESNDFFDDNDNAAPIIPVWSSTYLPYLKVYADELGIHEIGFEEFYYQMLPAMIKDQMLLGINWDRDGCGIEISAAEVYETISNRANS